MCTQEQTWEYGVCTANELGTRALLQPAPSTCRRRRCALRTAYVPGTGMTDQRPEACRSLQEMQMVGICSSTGVRTTIEGLQGLSKKYQNSWLGNLNGGGHDERSTKLRTLTSTPFPAIPGVQKAGMRHVQRRVPVCVRQDTGTRRHARTARILGSTAVRDPRDSARLN